MSQVRHVGLLAGGGGLFACRAGSEVGMTKRVRVLWDSTANRMSQADAKNTKNAIPVRIDGEIRWLTWPDRFDQKWVNGVWVLRCRFCGEYWLHGECECEVGWP